MEGITQVKVEEYRQHLIEEEKSRATIEKYMRDIQHFCNFIDKKGEIDKQTVIQYKQSLLKVYSVNSANSMIAALNGFLEFAGLYGLRVKRYKTQKKLFCMEEVELSKEEYIKLLTVSKKRSNKRLYLVLQTIGATGIRIGELKYFTVEGVKKGKIEVYCKNKVRVVFLPDQLRNVLLEYIERQEIFTGEIFITRSGKPLNRSNVWTDMKKLCEEANVPKEKVFPHNLRHLFARTYYEADKDITKLADVLGHSSIETTRIYTISSGKEHQKQLSGLGLVI